MSGNLEASCHLPTQRISFQHLQEIRVDNYFFQHGSLLTLAKNEFNIIDKMFSPHWDLRNGQHQLLAELVEAGGGRTVDSLRTGLFGTSLEGWSRSLSITLDYQAKRFATYLAEGTLAIAGPLPKSRSQTP